MVIKKLEYIQTAELQSELIRTPKTYCKSNFNRNPECWEIPLNHYSRLSFLSTRSASQCYC